jgi:hypothetical protein
MSGVYTNLAKKRIEQSQGASQMPPKSTEPKNQGVDIKEQLQEGKSPLRAIVADQNATPPLSEPAQQDASNIRSASVLASKQDSTKDSNQAIKLSLTLENIETVRKIVKNPGKEEVLYVRLSKAEKDMLTDISYTYKRQGIKTSDTEMARAAVNVLLEDYKINGTNSLLAIIIASLHA